MTRDSALPENSRIDRKFYARASAMELLKWRISAISHWPKWRVTRETGGCQLPRKSRLEGAIWGCDTRFRHVEPLPRSVSAI